jgi:DeoR/GlpR family transcriptional regulator of sugar metabolism
MYETRKRIIFDLLQQRGTVSVTELTAALGVSDMTVRRDIRSMAAEGLLRRVHGGAVSVEAGVEDKPFVTRQVVELERKRAIATRALTFLKGGESIYIDGSTTCGELAKLLPGDRRFMVVTDSLYVLLQLSGNRSIELVLLGGGLDKDGNTFDGVLTVENARRVMVDCCFFSAKGFATEYISNAVLTGSQVKQLMIHNSQRCFLLADSTKYGQRGLIKLCDWKDVSVLISDEQLGRQDLSAIKSQGTEIHLAELRAMPV